MEKIQQIHMNKIIWAHFLIKDGIRGDRILKEETLQTEEIPDAEDVLLNAHTPDCSQLHPRPSLPLKLPPTRTHKQRPRLRQPADTLRRGPS